MIKIKIQKIGHWLLHKYENETYMCSNCGQRLVTSPNYIKYYRYCFNCGAKMEGVKQ